MFPHARLDKLSWIVARRALFDSVSKCEKKAGNACRVFTVHAFSVTF